MRENKLIKNALLALSIFVAASNFTLAQEVASTSTTTIYSATTTEALVKLLEEKNKVGREEAEKKGNLNKNEGVESFVEFQEKTPYPRKTNKELLDEEKLKSKIEKIEFKNADLPLNFDFNNINYSSSKEERKLNTKFKNANLSETKKAKILEKLEKTKKKELSNTLKNDILTLKNKKTNRNKDKSKTDVQKFTEEKNDFDNLKKLNEKIKIENENNLKQSLNTDELSEIEIPEANILFQQDEIFTLNDVETKNINGGNGDWAINSILSDYPNIFSTVAVLERPIIVAVIDAGVDYNHEDLVGNMWTAINCVDENNNAIVGGCTNGYDFVGDDNNPYPTDNSDHGTAVASLIAASTDNGKGISSLSQNRTKIMALRVADSGYISLDNLTRAIYFAVNNNADVINMSLSGPTYSQNLFDALNYARSRGVKVIVSSGNQGLNLETNPVYPASYNLDNIFTVGSMDQGGSISSFSNYGINTVDVVAPGKNVLAAGLNNTYLQKTGTSFATPIFTSLVARWLSENKDVVTELGLLKTNANYLQYTRTGKTLAFSYANPAPTNYNNQPRYTLITSGENTGMYLDTQAKGGAVVNPSQANNLELFIGDSSVGIPYQISPTNNSTISGTCATFSWQAAANAKIYGLYIKNNITGANFYYSDNEGLNTSKYLCGFTPGVTYRWNTGAGKVNVSSPYNVTTANYFTVAGGGSKPSIPTGLSPAYSTGPGALTTNNSQSVSWTAQSGVTNYYVNVRNLNTNVLTASINTGTNNNYTFTNLISGNNYTWDLYACNSYGCSGNASNAYFYYQAPTANNNPPNTPTISNGVTTANTGVSVSYNFSATDPNSDNVKYIIDWGDGVIQNTGNFYTSGSTQSASHVYNSPGNFCVRAQAVDNRGMSGSYSSCTNISITQNTTAKPDLIVGTFSFANQAYAPGNTVNLSITVTNTGTALANFGFKTGIYLNNNLRLGEITSSGISANSSEIKTVSVTLPANTNSIYTGSGTYTLSIKADDTQQITNEVSENNNNAVKNITINIVNTANNAKYINFTGNINNQITDATFPISYTTNYPIGTRVDFVPENNISDKSYFITDSSNVTNIKLYNTNSTQRLGLSVSGNTIWSNNFSVSLANNTVAMATPATITYTFKNANGVPATGLIVQVKSCNDGQINCPLYKEKASDASGRIYLTANETKDAPGTTLQFIVSASNFINNAWEISKPTSPIVETIKLIANVSDNKTPVILIPGIMGSTLNSDSLIIPVLGKREMKSEDMKIVDAAGTLGWEDLRSALKANGYTIGKDVIDCPYDWRYSVDWAAKNYFAACVKKALELNPTKTKVDVVAHSMGGLVARAYIQQQPVDGVYNASKINQIVFVGTPHEGAAEAYFPWEGGDPHNVTREAVIERTYRQMYRGSDSSDFGITMTPTGTYLARIKFPKLFEPFATPLDMSQKKEIRRFLHEENILGVKQLLPTYDFLKNASGSIVQLNTHKNEFLLALNGMNNKCNNPAECKEDNGRIKEIYNYISLADAKSLGNIAMMTMMYGNKGNDTTYRINVTTGTTTDFYEDGYPSKDNSTIPSAGDETVPEISSKIFSENRSTIFNGVTKVDIGEHSQLVSIFKNQIISALVPNNPVLNSINLQTINTGRMNVSVKGNTNVLLTNSGNLSVGIDPITNNSIQTFANVENYKQENDATDITLGDPGNDVYKITLSGNTENDVTIYLDYKNIVTGTSTALEISVHKNLGTQSFYFSLNTNANTGDELIKLDAKTMQVVSNVKLTPTSNNKTKITFNSAILLATTTSTLNPIIATPTKYQIYSKFPEENNFNYIGEINSNATMTVATADTFAGSDNTLLKMYKIVSVYADGTNSSMSKTYFNNDTDWDGLLDKDELTASTTKTKADTDGDGLVDGVEKYVTETNPLIADTDNNGVDDYNQNKIKFSLVDKIIATTTVTVSTTTTVASWTINKGAPTTYCLREGHDLEGVEPTSTNSWKHTGVVFASTENSNATFRPNLMVKYLLNGVETTVNILAHAKDVTISSTGYGSMSWSQQRSNATGAFASQPHGSVSLGVYNGVFSGPYSQINRGFLMFDTSIIPTNAVVSSTTLNLVTTDVLNDYNDGKNYISLFKSTQQNWNDVVASDYQSCGNSLTNPTNVINSKSVNNFTNGQQIKFTFPMELSTTTEPMPLVNATPTIALVGSSTQSIYINTSWTDLFAVASDTEDGVITNNIAKLGNVNIDKVGNYPITYSITDTGGNTATITRNVNVMPLPSQTYTAVTPGLINQGGYSNFCLREGHDIAGVAPVNYSGWKHTGVVFASMENSTVNNRPLLEISYLLNNIISTTTISAHIKDVTVNGSGYPRLWTAMREDTTGILTSQPHGNSQLGVYSGAFNDTHVNIQRSLLMFDTTNIPVNATITSASVKLTPTDVMNEFPDGKNYISLFKSTQASNVDVTGNDWQACGNALTNPTDTISTFQVPEFTIGVKKNFSFPSTVVSFATSTPITYAFTDIPSIMNLKLNGILGSDLKKTDEVSGNVLITNEINAGSKAGRDGLLNGAYEFTGTGNVQINSPITPTTTPMTVSLWYKSNTIADSTIFSWVSDKISPNQSRDFLELRLSGGNVRSSVGWSTGGNQDATTPFSTINIVDNKWHKIDMTLENNNGVKLKLYVDGNLVGNNAVTSAIYNFNTIGNKMLLGSNKNWFSQAVEGYVYGLIDDVKLYNKALTNTEITDQYNSDAVKNALTSLSGFGLDNLEEDLPIIVIPSVIEEINNVATDTATSTAQVQ